VVFESVVTHVAERDVNPRHQPSYSPFPPPLFTAGHFVYDKCSANAYSDFHIGLDYHVPCNVLIEVEDLSPDLVTDHLSLWLFNGSIPEDRWSERRSLYSSNKIWSISLSSNEVSNGEFFLSVKYVLLGSHPLAACGVAMRCCSRPALLEFRTRNATSSLG
jgi:hypothetical protein